MSLLSVVPMPYRILGIVLLCVSLFGFGWLKGASHTQDQWDDANAKAANTVLAIKAKQAEVTTKVVTQYVDRVKTIKEKGDTIIEQVPIYVTAKDDAGCVIPDGFRLLWDAANRGALPGTTGDPDASPGEIVLSDVETQHAKESKLCRATEEQLIGLQEWIMEQQAVK